ncbi:MAG: aminoglycoside phosphotransferase family protein [Devosia sp.]
MMRPGDFDAEALRAVVVGKFPQLADAPFHIMGAGWDSVALAVGDHVFKFPRNAIAATALRREANLLRQIGPAVSMPVPRMDLSETPTLFSSHIGIAGDHLLTDAYERLGDAQRQALGDAMGQFYAQLHALPVTVMIEAGALPAYRWLDAATIERQSFPLLDAAERAWAGQILTRWVALGPDPHGNIYGYFDGHGWNMAFDHEHGRLNGLYDFADSGIGPLHQEFLYSSFISADLTARIVAAYERHAGRSLERERIAVLTGVHRLWELAAAENADDATEMLASVRAWMAAG